MTMPERSQQAYDDEIDLRDLVMVLVEGWYWIAGTILIAVAAALAYVLIKTPIYETEFRAVPAPEANFAGFDLLGEDFEITPEMAYRALGNRLSSYQNFQEFFDSHEGSFKVEEDEGLSQVFADRLTINGLNADQNESLSLTVKYAYPEGENGADILNGYIESTAKGVWTSLREQFHEYNRAQIARLETELELQRESLQNEREHRLFTLEQAIEIARRLGIEKPTTPQQFGRQPSGSEVFYANISGDGSLPLYFMGYQALEADRDTLKGALDKGLSSGLIRGTEQQLKQHRRIAELLDNEAPRGVDRAVEQNYVERVVEVVEFAYQSASYSEPRKALIFALALVIGGMVGIFALMIARLVRPTN